MNKKPDDAIYIRIPLDLRKRIDNLRRRQTVRPTLVETVRVLIEKGLDQVEAGDTSASECRN
jgi:predicted DNA-binding protein